MAFLLRKQYFSSDFRAPFFNDANAVFGKAKLDDYFHYGLLFLRVIVVGNFWHFGLRSLIQQDRLIQIWMIIPLWTKKDTWNRLVWSVGGSVWLTIYLLMFVGLFRELKSQLPIYQKSFGILTMQLPNLGWKQSSWPLGRSLLMSFWPLMIIWIFFSRRLHLRTSKW